ncbi:MAG: DUF1566 domain-containing protein [Bacteroidales bacterium]|nr:DUF1566 domain-containing protein [Bacteroidales bacterium]
MKVKKGKTVCLIACGLICLTACKKEQNKPEIPVKAEQVKIIIRMPEEASASGQKLGVASRPSDAYLYWENSDKIKFINVSNSSAVLTYSGQAADTSAIFSLSEGNLNSAVYIGFRPISAIANAYNNIVYSTPDVYTLDPVNPDGYLNDNMLMYTTTPYNYGSDTVAIFRPAMTVLEIPLQTLTGEYVVKEIKLIPVYTSPSSTKAFIRSAKLPDIINAATALTNITYCDTLTYRFSGEGLVVGSSPGTLRLLVWSNPAVTNLKGYFFLINTADYKRSITRVNQPFLNTKYYRLPNLSIPDSVAHPTLGSRFGGGIVCYIFQPGDGNVYVPNQTHGLICTEDNLPLQYTWGCVNTLINVFDSVLGTGMNNTRLIVNAGCGGAALACYNLVENGYSDWFLPSKHELVVLRQKINHDLMVGGPYWSSTEYSSDKAYRIPWEALATTTFKTDTQRIRPVRYF